MSEYTTGGDPVGTEIMSETALLAYKSFTKPGKPELNTVIKSHEALGSRLDAVVKALRANNADLHNWSTRPCSTCAAVTAVSGILFGCDAYRKRHENSQERLARKDKRYACTRCVWTGDVPESSDNPADRGPWCPQCKEAVREQ